MTTIKKSVSRSDPQKTARENSQKYFDKYGKLKRTSEALDSPACRKPKPQIDHLESIQNSLNIALSADDLVQIKAGIDGIWIYQKTSKTAKNRKSKANRFHYISSDGYDMYVGKNNYQNDELTFKFATGNDWWFHAKRMPGSHVNCKKQREEKCRTVYLKRPESLPAYYSSGRDSDKLEIDYLAEKRM